MSLEEDNLAAVKRAWAESQRVKFKPGMHLLYAPLYDALCQELDGTFWAPTSGRRTFAEQATLYAKGRTKTGPRVTNALPGDSPHNWGCASDWAEFRPNFKGQDPWEKADWVVFRTKVEKVGMRWGGDWNGNLVKDKNDWDLAHAELPLGIAWKKIGDLYRVKGIAVAEQAIAEQFKGGKK